MDTLLRYITLLLMTGMRLTLANEPLDNEDLIEYCEGETFHAQCAQDEVIVIQAAEYGRMKLGRCLTANYGNIGCHENILAEMDGWCSGRHECEVRVSSIIDGIPESHQPCPRDFRGYLEASYICVKVIHKSNKECQAQPQAMITSPSSGFLASVITEETTCGSLDCPWVVNIPSGQTIKLTLFDFAVANRDTSGFVENIPNVCHVYAVIKERTIKASDTVCGSNVRESWVYTSVTNNVELRLVTPGQRKDREVGYFMLKYEVVGCADLPSPAYGWQNRIDSSAIFGCNDTKDTWRLNCDGSKWVGHHKNCTRPVTSSKSIGNTLVGIFTGSQWAAIVIILVIAVVLGLVIFLIGLVYLKRKRSNRDGLHGPGHRHAHAIPDYYSPQYHDPSDGPGPPYTTTKPLSALENYSSAENDYYRTWQLQRHPPAGMHFNTNEDGTRPVMEHIYESPKFDRKEMRLSPHAHAQGPDGHDVGTGTGLPSAQYYELDPSVMESHPSQASHMTG